MSETTNANSKLLTVVTRYVKLLIEDTRLGLTEKLVQLLSAVTICALLLIFALVALLFATVGLSYVLSTVVSPATSFFIVSGIFVLLIVALLLFKRQLIIDPISRFLSKLLLAAPTTPNTGDNDDTTTVS